MARTRTAVTAVVLALAGLTACSSESAPVPTPTPVFTSTLAAPAPQAIAPLTGEPVDAALLAHSSFAAKIDNHVAARPQVGLERTDMVFEELVEGGLSRYVAVWHSDVPDEIGPVRSIRPMDPDIVSAFGGIIAYSGGQQRFVALMQATNVFNAIHGQAATADTFFRTKSKKAPHNVIVRASTIVAAHPEIAAPQQQFAFAADTASATATKDGTPATQLNLRFSNATAPSWTWDAASGTYLRAQLGVADLDSNGNQLTAVNVLALRVGVTVSQSIPKTELLSSGEAWVSSGGGTIHATWSKDAATSVIRLVDDQGVTVRLAPGNTWIELVPTAGSVEFLL